MNGQTDFIFKECFMKKVSSKISLLFSAPFIKAAAFLTCFALSQPVFAQDAIKKLDSTAQTVVGIFTSYWVRGILAISLCSSAIMFAVNKDNDKVKRNCLAVGIAAFIIICASSIVDFFMDS
jgi:DMSO/TMAO reductase YedYZ heme-binding membrane subunit